MLLASADTKPYFFFLPAEQKMDAKDILGLPKNTLTIPQEKKSRPPKEPQRNPDGISRELYMLTGGVASLMPSIDVAQLKKRPPSDEKKWTREETDLLFGLCKRFDLHFVIIADRFPSSRSMEELKDRYYSVSRAILVARAPSPTDVSNHPLVKELYNAQLEIECKRALSMFLSQTKQQERRDTEVLAEAKRIAESQMSAKELYNAQLEIECKRALSMFLSQTKQQERRDTEVLAEAKRIAESQMSAKGAVESESPAALDANAENTESSTIATAAPSNPVADNAATRASLQMMHVYLRTFVLEEMVQALNTSSGLRTIKRVEQTLQDLGINLKPKVPTKQVCLEHLESRKEMLTLLNLQKQFQYKESEGSSYRDGSYSDMPGTPKDHAFQNP